MFNSLVKELTNKYVMTSAKRMQKKEIVTFFLYMIDCTAFIFETIIFVHTLPKSNLKFSIL